MLIFVSGATRTVRELAHSHVGAMFVPRARNIPETTLCPGMPWIADNGAFTGFDTDAFVRMLGRLKGTPGCVFIVAPDVVGDARRTLRCFRLWEPMIHACGFPVAFVGQDGLDLRQVPWQSCDAVFLGGSTEFKLGPVARDLASYAATRGKWAHMGRVNSLKRMTYAAEIGCSSVDGQQWSAWADRWLKWGADHAQGLRR